MRRPEDGFSLVELMVAMTVTLIVSAAIYGLLTSGSNAFRREARAGREAAEHPRRDGPRLARRVQRGSRPATFSQVFTRIDPTGAPAPARWA